MEDCSQRRLLHRMASSATTASSQSCKQPSLLTQFSKFVHSGVGLEKTLRFLQALSQIVSALSIEAATAARWKVAKSQIAIARKYFTFFNFIDCFQRVFGLLLDEGDSGGGSGLIRLIGLAKWSCFGLKYILEDLTILHAMGVYSVSWHTPVLIEVNRFWFYALSLSLLEVMCALAFAGPSRSSREEIDDKSGRRQAEDEKLSGNGTKPAPAPAPAVSVGSSTALKKSVVVDACDLFIPGSFLGWIPVNDTTVGMAMVVSTLVAMQDVWKETLNK